MVVKEWDDDDSETEEEVEEENFFLETGDYYFKKGDYQKALEFYLKEPDAWVDIGNVYFKLGDYQKALEYYEKDSSALYQQGLMYFLLKDESNALKRWLHACLRGDASAASRLGIMFYVVNPEYAARWFWRVNDKFNLGFIFAYNKNIIFKDLPPITDSEIKFDLGNIYNKENKTTLAQSYWLDSKLPKAADILNEIYKKQGKIKNVIFEDPPDTTEIVSRQRLLWARYYNFYIQETNNKKFQKLILPDADDTEQDAVLDYFDQGLLALRTKNYDLARFFFTIGTSSNYFPAMNKLGDLLYEHFEEYNNAIDVYYKNVISDSELTSSVTADSIFKIGYIYYKFMKDDDLAIEWFNTAIQNNYHLGYYYLGKIYFKMGKKETAIENLRVSSQYENPKAYYLLGKITGDIDYYRKAIELGNNKAILALGLYYISKREYLLAIDTLTLGIDKMYAPAIFELGKLYKKLNKKQEAMSMLLLAAKYKNEDALLYLLALNPRKNRDELLKIAYYFKFYNALFEIAKYFNIENNFDEEGKIYKFILDNEPKNDELIATVYDKLGEANIFKKDIINAMKYFNLAESKGHAKNKFAQKKDYIEIFDLVNQANESERAIDYYNVGLKFESIGIDFLGNAGMWYQKAADKRFPPAEYKLGFLFHNLDWMKEAAKHDYPDALYFMSTVTENQDIKADYFNRALSKGQRDAQYVRATELMANYQTEEAIELYKESSSKGNALATLELGNLEFNIDPDKALEYYTLSIKQNPNPDAYFNSGLIYYQKAEKYKKLGGQYNLNFSIRSYDTAKDYFLKADEFKSFGARKRLNDYKIVINELMYIPEEDLDKEEKVFNKPKPESYYNTELHDNF